jgi:acetylornithine deacetylase/succinyl-diaminopimelate desuccinylase-like protein
VNRNRLLDTAARLVARPSPTGAARAAADELAAILAADGFAVERPIAAHPDAPAVVARLSTGRPGRVLQFSGHLDTVHLPFAPPRVTGDRLTGSGAADMKGGIAAAVEAMRAARDAGAPAAGEILLTAYDLHESPWGDGRQLDALIAAGCVGDAVLIPEYFNAALPVIGRGGFIWTATVRRPGPAVHEVYRPAEPSVIAAGAELVARLGKLDAELARDADPLAGAASLFVGTIQSGAIYNEFPQTCRLEGTRRWLPGTRFAEADAEFRALCAGLAADTGTAVEVETRLMRDAFRLDTAHPFVGVFQSAYAALVGERLPAGGKPFVDDGNSFWSLAGVPAITHGPTAGGAHTTAEWVNVDDLVRVARLYALTAATFCPGDPA